MILSERVCNKKEDYITYFKNNTNQPNPLGKLFKTTSNSYMYDTGTSKVMMCSHVEYSILEKILNGQIDEIMEIGSNYNEDEFVEALENVRQAIEQQDILKGGGTCKFVSLGHFEKLDKKLEHGLEQITLELTEVCNLRCGYCIYNDTFEHKRNFGTKEMSIEVAQKAIDYLNLHGNKNRGVAITFYGGEPLTNFKLLKQCVEYSKKTITDKEIFYSMTTNLTLMTPEIANYLASIKNYSVVCSIDGPKEIHDSYRKDINGNGSFTRAIKGLKYIVDAFKDRAKDAIILSMVFAPPYSIEKLDTIEAFFNELDWFPKDIQKMVTYPSTGSVKVQKTPDQSRITGKELVTWSIQNYEKYLKGNATLKFFSKKVSEDSLLRVHNRRIKFKASNEYFFNACCVPASRKIYVTVDGNFEICEKMDGSPNIGNVFDGLDKNKIKDELINSYAEKSINECSKCWAANLCRVCYVSCYTDGKFDVKKKNKECEKSRQAALRNLIFYHKSVETNPEKLKYLNKIEVF